MEEFLSKLPEYLAIAASVVGAAAYLATLTPNKSDDRIVQIILDVINFLGANFGNAKNDRQEVGTGGDNPPKTPPGGGG